MAVYNGWDIDLDDGSSHYVIENNLLTGGGLKLREGYNRTVRNNLIVNNGFHFHVWPENSDNNRIVHNITTAGYVGNVEQPPEWGVHCDRNFQHLPGEPTEPAAKMQQISMYDCHSLQGDAHFKNAEQGDWTLSADSPALKVHFTPFPLDNFGVTNQRLKPKASEAFNAAMMSRNQGKHRP